MKKSEAKERILKLRSEIEKHRIAYHVHDKPTISDEAYDSLMKELITLEEKFPEFYDSLSPTQVGADKSQEVFLPKKRSSSRIFLIPEIFKRR